MTIGVFGGTFDPPHLGHLRAAAAALDTLALDRLIFMPAGLPPHKPLDAATAPAACRYDMVRLMADGLQRGGAVEVSRLELNRPGPSYTADTLDALCQAYPNAALTLLVGADMFLSMQSWHAPERVFALARVAAFARGDGEEARLTEQAAYLSKTYGAETLVLPLPEVTELSSTALRGQLAAGDSAAADGLWPPVYGYILLHGLYGTPKTPKHLSNDELLAASLSMIQYKRAAHIRGTAAEAVRLAARWGADTRDAERAAILHDCTKYFPRDEHLALCSRHGIVLDEVELGAEKLLHSKTAAALARDVFGENAAVVRAIFTHTTGAPRMDLLQKIIYVADYIEPSRDFPEVAHLRALAYEDLDRTVGECLALSAREVAQKGRVLHHNTVEALAAARRMGYV